MNSIHIYERSFHLKDTSSSLVRENAKKNNLIEKSTQTDNGHINVISNVNLSETSLNLILNRVIEDMYKSAKNSSQKLEIEERNHRDNKNIYGRDIRENKIFKENEIKETKLNCNNILCAKKFNSNHYNSNQQINKRTSSLEVNTSEYSSEDDSDSISLVDSLEGSPIPKTRYKPKKDATTRKKNSSFFVPIEEATFKEVKSIADHFPSKLKEKISKRQVEREQSFKEMRKNESSNSLPNSIENSPKFIRRSESFKTKKSKLILPRIVPTLSENKAVQCKRDEPQRNLKGRNKFEEKFKRQEDSNSEKSNFTNKGFFNKIPINTNSKKIKILEVVECVPKTKVSRIPKLIRPKLPKITRKNSAKESVKIKRITENFIANILMDTVNAAEVTNVSNVTYNDFSMQSELHKGSFCNRYLNNSFHSIPDLSQRKLDYVPNTLSSFPKIKGFRDGVARESKKRSRSFELKGDEVEFLRDGNMSMPKGWVTLYTIHKSSLSSGSSSDDGTNLSVEH